MRKRIFFLTSSNSSGQSTVEFILIFMVLIVVMLGIIDFSRAWWELNSLNLGAREGARHAVVTPNLELDDTRVIEYVCDTLDAVIDPDELTVTVTFDNLPNPVAGDVITASVVHTFHSCLGSLIPSFPETVNLIGRSSMRYEVY